MTLTYTISALHSITGLDRRKLGDLLTNVAPHEIVNGRKRYTVKQLIAALLHGGADLNSARIRLTLAQADKAELEAEVLRGNLIPKHDVVTGVGRLVSDARQRLMGLGYGVAAIHGAEVGAFVDQLTHDALEALADGDVADRLVSRQ